MFRDLVFLGAKPIGYKCLKYLIENKSQLKINISAVFTNQRIEFGGSNNLLELCSINNIPVLSNLEDLPQCHIIYSIQYNLILNQRHIEKASMVAVNLHMAPLPEYRGSNQFSYAIIDNKIEFGTTIHRMSAGIDSGDILFQKRFPIPSGCWVNELYNLTFEASCRLFEQTIAHVINGDYKPLPQALLVAKYGTSMHYRDEINKLKHIDLNWDADKIERHIRATSMPGFEPPYCVIDNKKIYFSDKY